MTTDTQHMCHSVLTSFHIITKHLQEKIMPETFTQLQIANFFLSTIASTHLGDIFFPLTTPLNSIIFFAWHFSAEEKNTKI